jgi:hypothetical protein
VVVVVVGRGRIGKGKAVLVPKDNTMKTNGRILVKLHEFLFSETRERE